MRFFLGDDNGQLKSVKCSKTSENEWKIEASLLDDGGKAGKTRAVQRLAVKREKIALARGDGTAASFITSEGAESVHIAQQWLETRFRPEHQYIGLDITETGGVISCTSAGHMRMQYPAKGFESEAGVLSDTTFIPNRLSELVVSDDTRFFAYGGDEVEVSVWDTTRAFDPSRQLLPASTLGVKRKNHSELIDGETWRARNVPNDYLNLRQPVHNTTLVFLSPISGGNGSSHHILAGTKMGSVRRYDTRAGRRPVADWRDIGRVGGVRKVQRGNSEHEAFIADYGGNMSALDLRTGRVLYTYGGIAGAISSLVSTSSYLSPPLLASTSLDRFFRLHSTHKPPMTSGASIDKRGEVLAKLWIKSAAGCVAWDGVMPGEPPKAPGVDEEEDDVWAGMQHVGEERGSSSESNRQKSKQQRVR